MKTKLIYLITIFIFVACTGENGVDGKDGKNAEEVNVDSISNVIRKEITNSLWDSLYSQPFVDTVYTALFDNAFATSWMDSVREALIDSLKQANYDSLYKTLYDSVYSDIYSQSMIKGMDAYIYIKKEDIYGAFANQYPLMYKDFKSDDNETLYFPLSVKARNTCSKSLFDMSPCTWKKILVKAYIPDFTDTATVTEIANPDSSVTLAPQFNFNKDALAKLTAPIQTQFQVRTYVLENEREILFHSESVPTTIHPMQIRGAEYQGVEKFDWWYGVWVTPSMDSITQILDEVANKLPDGVLKTYQKYSQDSTIEESSARVVKAIFEVLQSKGISYVQNPEAGSRGQKILYPIEVLRTKHAICIDGSLLFMSVMEATGLKPYLIEIPGHAFVGWRTEEKGTTIDMVETTLAWNDSKTPFADAVEKARNTYNEQIELGNFDSGVSKIIDLEKVREYGIMPNDVK